MTKNEFIKRYNEVTEVISDNRFYSCYSIGRISEKCRETYHDYMGDWLIPTVTTESCYKEEWFCTVDAFNQIDRMFAMELFFHACLTEKWYK